MVVCQLVVDRDGAQAPILPEKFDISVDELSLVVLAVLGMPLFGNFKLIVLHNLLLFLWRWLFFWYADVLWCVHGGFWQWRVLQCSTGKGCDCL
jgi:hypothetical protein